MKIRSFSVNGVYYSFFILSCRGIFCLIIILFFDIFLM